MKKPIKNKKGINEVGAGIIAMALLLLVGGIFFSDDSSNNNSGRNGNNDGDGTIDESYLFFINNTNIGRQNKVTENFPNIQLGAKEEYDVIYIGNNFRLVANPLTSNKYEFDVDITDLDDSKYLFLYFTPNRISGDNQMIVKMNGKEVIKTLARSNDVPLSIPLRDLNSTKIRLSFEIEKPRVFHIFNWNKLDIGEFKIMEMKEMEENKIRKFNFQADKLDLENVFIDVVVTCEDKKEVSEAIEIKVNDYIISNENPSCLSRYNKITANVPLNIINNEKNSLVFETEGYYKVAYSINKVYYNEKDVYKFTVNNFNDMIDVIIYGDFDEEVIDMRLNGHMIQLQRDELKSIIHLLKYGNNELKILTKPVDIDELIIEKSQYNSY